jgi:mannose-6-phosphate isomerase-like protein (cupin superfamily)
MSYRFTPMDRKVIFDVRQPVAAIVAQYRARLAAAPEDDIAGELRQVLALLPEVTPVETDNLFGDPSHKVGQFIDAALVPKTGTVEAVLAVMRPLARTLPWRYNYEPRADRPGLENRMAWAEFIGSEAPIRSPSVCLGVTLIGPHTLYPLHHHPAVELYFVISGTATWTKAGVARRLPPGSFVLHESNVVHAMETGDEPLLAAYAWTGDIDTLSTYE